MAENGDKEREGPAWAKPQGEDPKGEREKRADSRPYLGDTASVPGGTSGGELNRKIGARDDEKRAFERPAGNTDVKKSDKAAPPPSS